MTVLPGGRLLLISAAVGLVLAGAAPVEGIAQTDQDAKLAGLINSTSNPVPIIPIAVPEDSGVDEVEYILAAGNIPSIFQISQPKGQYFDPAKIRFFEMLAAEYPLKIHFRKVAAGSLAALRLYNHAVTKPVYVLCDPVKSGDTKCAFIDEAALPEEKDVKQTTIENFIDKQVGVAPTLLTTFSLTPANMRSLVFDYRPDVPDAAPTSKWMAVLFFPGGRGATGSINRARALVALERFFYPNRLRIAECDLSTAGAVYEALVQHVAKGAVPAEAELWLFDPATRHGLKYTEIDGSTQISGLTHASFEGWLANNGVAAPPDAAIDIETAWQELAKLDPPK